MLLRRRPRPAPAPAPPPDVEAIVAARLAPLRDEIDKLWASAAHLPLLDRQLGARIDELGTRIQALDELAVHLQWGVDAAAPQPDELTARDVLATTAWIAALPPQPLRISVLMATRDRLHVLPRAIASVLGQTHADLELVIVDDGSTDGTREYLAGLDDPRIVVGRTGGDGQSAALNHAQSLASGDAIAYLDDDNEMEPLWLAGVAWALCTRPDADVVYGARIREREPGEAGPPSPKLELHAWDRSKLEQINIMDQNVIAHRAGLPGTRLDPESSYAQDWELALRITAGKAPVALPLIAARYHTSAANRCSDVADAGERTQAVRRAAFRSRPLRVLALASPPVDAVLPHLAIMGAEVTVLDELPARTAALPAPRPDVVLLPGAAAAVRGIRWLERHQLPFVLCAGSPDPVTAHWLRLDTHADTAAMRRALEAHRGIAAPVRAPTATP
jgi:hypothetical protein